MIESIVAITGFGKAFRIFTASGEVEILLNFHYGPVWALSAGLRSGYGEICVTGGDDKWINVWSVQSRGLVTRVRAKYPVRCCHLDSTASFVAVGLAGGGLSVYKLEIPSTKGAGFTRPDRNPNLLLSEIASRKDCVEDISDIKFSPNDRMLAVGSHDGYIDVYSCGFSLGTHLESGTTDIRYLKRLRGHVSYITHLDWSADNRLLQSTCGAYEILYWDVTTGKQLLSTTDALESDTIWNTFTCALGFPVMGIWPPNSDGTDVNSVDVLFQKGLVVTGDDFGKVNLFNYPCVVKGAPSVSMSGHSSHVMNVRTVEASGGLTYVCTVGGNDNSVMVWTIRRRQHSGQQTPGL
jgi:WD40 repeat protein